MPQTLQLLDTAVEIEEAAARIYDQFALRFADNQEYGPLFHRLAGEEREHADRVRAVRALVDGSGLQVDGMDSEHLAMLLKLANDIEEMLRDDPRDVFPSRGRHGRGPRRAGDRAAGSAGARPV